MVENIFAYEGDRKDLVEIFYKNLVTGKEISYTNVLTEYDGGILSVSGVTKHNLYQKLKHVAPEVVKTLKDSGYIVLEFPNGRSTNYQYIGSNNDPLKNIRFKALIKERYQTIAECIKGDKAFKIKYKPFDKNSMEIIFHPHILRIYNGRSFALGVSQKEGKKPFRRFCIALDRIEGEIHSAGSSCRYMPSKPNEYLYLANIVGVSLERGKELSVIKFRALDSYTFGRLETKPLHDSQKATLYPDNKQGRDFGEFEMSVIPNKELIGQILSYGSRLEILSPNSLKEIIYKELCDILHLYQ